jgi:RimJ/RimL family protein N-acetyltransferase
MSLQLSTDRLHLRPIAASDAAAVIAYRNHPEVTRFQDWQPQSEKDIAAAVNEWAMSTFPKEGTWLSFVLEERATRRVIGDLAVRGSGGAESVQCELGITLDPAAQGHGLATEALTGLLAHLFTVTGVHRVFASLDPANIASRRLFERRLGFRLEAHHIESLWWREQWADDLIVALLRREWTARVKDS